MFKFLQEISVLGIDTFSKCGVLSLTYVFALGDFNYRLVCILTLRKLLYYRAGEC